MTPKQQEIRKPRGVLMLLAGLLLFSGVIRASLGFDNAYARAPNEVPDSAPIEVANCPLPPIAVIEALKSREERLEHRETALAERLSSLSLAETVIENKLKELKAAEESLAETLARSDGAAEGDLSRLTAVYEAMKPKDAALLFETMAPDFAAGFLGRMRPEAAAAVMSGMNPESAYTISVLLAGRNALVPTD